jgi:peptidoglycan hydrolase-like protein with peptidoglycan-binding domain
MSREGIDYAWHGQVNAQAIKAAGKSFVMRYLSHDDSKDLHRSEAALLASHGIDVGVVWELRANRALAGWGAGAQDAREALAQARACGMPAGRPIYFAVDWDATDAQKPAIAKYLGGAASVLGKEHVGVYGSYYVVKYMFDHGVCKYGWQTYAWSGGHRDPRAQLYQHLNGQRLAGLSVDFDTAYHEDFGQWRPGGHVGHAPKFPFPATDYIAVQNGDAHAHSGDDPADRPLIKKWEHRMLQRGWRIHDDGLFDKEADQITRKFQREKGLKEDGKVGPHTWEAAWMEPVT